METTELIKVDPKEFGIEESKANQIVENFKPVFDKIADLESEYNEVLAIPLEDVSASFKAKELRKKYVKIRTSAAEIHKNEKSFFLTAGRFIDRVKNFQLEQTNSKEEKLEAIEKHFENLEKARIEALNLSRIEVLKQYGLEGASLNLGQMDENIWISFLSGTKTEFERKKAEAEKAEQERVEKEKAEADERERVIVENERLKAENEAKEKELQEQKAKADAELKKAEAIRLKEQAAADKLLEDQRKIADDKAKKEKAASDAKLKAEREVKEKLESELKVKKDAEAKAEAERIAEEKAKKAAEEKAKKAPDKIKIKSAIDALPEMACAVTTDEGERVFNQIRAKYSAFKDWAQTQVNTL